VGRPDDRDEVHAGSWSFDRLAATVERLFGYPYTMPSHQGAAPSRSCCLNK